jgi:hypothetical protein
MTSSSRALPRSGAPPPSSCAIVVSALPHKTIRVLVRGRALPIGLSACCK